MNGGTYTLLIELPGEIDLSIGALGSRTIDQGWYAYTGSALGAAGFSRVDRHRRVAAGEHDVRHWHVDYLLGHDAAALRDVVRAPGADVECAVARELPDTPVAGFGASDCDCEAHLGYAREEAELRRHVEAAYADR